LPAGVPRAPEPALLLLAAAAAARLQLLQPAAAALVQAPLARGGCQ